MCKLVYTLYTDKYKTLLRKTKEHVKKEKEKEKMEEGKKIMNLFLQRVI